jgi:hypothetical protein
VSARVKPRQWQELARLYSDHGLLGATAVDDFMALLVA